MRSRILDPETGKDVPQGQQGEMLLAGPNIMLGYLNRPEANEETLVKDEEGTVWLRTGDIARVDEEGWFYIMDRLKELIKVKGFRALRSSSSLPSPVELTFSLVRSKRNRGPSRRTRSHPPRVPLRLRLRRNRSLGR